ncbi:hypothetical protein [Paradesulfitobacterium ferrireducens]|uniref:hypothetical protein n=1 Tax=Paradesulfitobacterium ferrireducens TaxID=2816476 RepID=UPI001A90A129|nr:hypothetical protein [Paradesulfitobacterium ferrireducens]
MGRVDPAARLRCARNLSQSGFASLIVLIILTTAVSLGMGIYLKANGENRVAEREVQGRQAVYAAEAGIEWAKYQLGQNLSWRGGTFTWEGGQTVVTVAAVNGTYQVTASAQASLARRKIQADLKLDEGVWVTSKYQELHY